MTLHLRLILVPMTVVLGNFLLGCKVDESKEIGTYRSVLDDGQTRPEAFTQGDALSLERALALANQHNERLGLAGEDYLQALIDKNRAAASFLPTLAFEPTFFTQDRVASSGSGTIGGSTGGRSSNSRFDAPVTSGMNLFNGFRDVANLRSAARTAEQRRALLLEAQATVLLDVARVYYQILRAERSVDVLRNSLKLQDERLRDTKARLQAGFARPLDVAQTEAQASATRVSLITAINDVENGRAVLAFLTGAPAAASPLTDENIPVEVTAEMSIDELRQIAFDARQDLTAALSAIEAARQNVRSAFGQYFPSVAVDLNYFLSRESNPTESDWNALFRLNLPIFSAGLIEADVRTALSELRQARYNESLTRRQILQDVEIAQQNLRRSRERVDQLRVQLVAASEALRQSEELYKVGSGTNLDRLTSQDALLSTQLALTSERFNRNVFYLNLLRIVGRLSTKLPGEPTTGPTTMPLSLR